jgi:alpha-amylase
MDNKTMFQFFHWYIRPEDKLWLTAGEQASFLAHLGISHVWLPPAYKSAYGIGEPGYAVYDLYDLGEFNQKETVATRYGTRPEYIAAINSFHDNGISVLADIVLNHKLGADEQELVEVAKVNSSDRNQTLSEPEMKEIWSKFYFPGRNKQYSDFVWDWHSFTGTSEDSENIYLIRNEHADGKWEEMLEDENGNYDYLMGLDIEFRNPHVREELKKWGRWYIESTQIDGFRLDALKHIQHKFFNEWLDEMNANFKKKFICIGEYWRSDVHPLLKYIEATGNRIQLFDVPLHYNFHKASTSGKDFDMRSILDNTLVKDWPDAAITFVDNHDTQPMQSLESPVEEWFKPLAYALILLRQQGTPVVFYPTVYGAKYWGHVNDGDVEINLPPVNAVIPMLNVRKNLCYGMQRDYFDDHVSIGWTVEGVDEKNGSGCAIVLTTGDATSKEMEIGKRHVGIVFRDICNNVADRVTINGDGCGNFPVNAGSVSVWVREDALPEL